MAKGKYCSKCASVLVTKTDHQQCPNCGTRFYDNSVPAAGVFLIKGNQVLLAKRAVDPHQGTLDVVGGFLKADELPVDGAKREVKEETGTDCQLIQLLGMYTDDYSTPQTLDTSLLAIIYIGKIIKGQPMANDDASELVWVSIDNPPLGEIGFKSIRQALKDLAKWHKAKRPNP